RVSHTWRSGGWRATVGPMSDSTEKPSPPIVDFVYGGVYQVRVDLVVSVAPNRPRGQVAIQLKDGAYTVWHDVADPYEAARQLLAVRASIPGIQRVDYQPPSSRELACDRVK